MTRFQKEFDLMVDLSEIAIELKDDSRIVDSGIHDAAIANLSLSEVSVHQQSLEIELRAESGERYVLKAEKITHLEMAFFGHQNVISEIYVFNKRDALRELMEIVNLETFTSYTYVGLNERIKSGELSLLKIDAAVGADILVICERVGLFGMHSEMPSTAQL